MNLDWHQTTTDELISDDVLFIGDGYRAKNREFGPSGIPFARVANVKSGGELDLDGADLFPLEDIHKVGNKISQPGDVAFTSKGTVGRFIYIRQQTPQFVYSPQISFWRVLDQAVVEPRFVLFWMQGREFREQINGLKAQTDMADYVSLGDQRKMAITLPPLPIQHRIAEILGRLDDKIEVNRRTNSTLEAMAQALYKHWFVEFGPFQDGEFVESELGLIPKGWEVGKVGDVTEIHDRLRIPLSKMERAKRQGNYPYYGATSVMDYIDDFIFEGEYVLIGEDGSVIKEDNTPFVQYVFGQFWVNNHAHVLQGKNGISTEHLKVFFDQVNVRPFVTGAVQAKINQRNLKSIPFLLAPPNVNQAFGNFLQPWFAKIRSLQTENEQLTTTRDYLLPRLLSGEVDFSGLQNARINSDG